jgi:hypothetical protein
MEIRKTLETIAIVAVLGWLTYSYFIRDGDTQRQIEKAEMKADSVARYIEQSQDYIITLQKMVQVINVNLDSMKIQNAKTVKDIQGIENRYQTRKKRQDLLIQSRIDSIKTQFKRLSNEISYHYFPYYYYLNEPLLCVQLPIRQPYEG